MPNMLKRLFASALLIMMLVLVSSQTIAEEAKIDEDFSIRNGIKICAIL